MCIPEVFKGLQGYLGFQKRSMGFRWRSMRFHEILKAPQNGSTGLQRGFKAVLGGS